MSTILSVCPFDLRLTKFSPLLFWIGTVGIQDYFCQVRAEGCFFGAIATTLSVPGVEPTLIAPPQAVLGRALKCAYLITCRTSIF